MRRVAVMLLCAGAALAQHVTSVDKLPFDVNGFVTRHAPMPCTVSVIKPTLNLSFRFQTEYVVRTPLRPYAGAQHHWYVAFAVTPEGDDRQPVYFTDSIDLPAAPQADLLAEATGEFFVGEGRYDVKWSLLDDLGRVCRQEWTVDAHLTGRERSAKVAVPTGTAGDFSWRPASSAPAPATKTRHVTILLNAALPLANHANSGAGQWDELLSILSAQLEEMPGATVRLIVFNLAQQREILRQEGFTIADMSRIQHAADGSEQWAVDSGVLLRPSGAWDLLHDLESSEMHASAASDTEIFLSLPQQTAEKMPAGMPESERSPRYFYLEDRSSARGAPDSPQLGVGGGGGRGVRGGVGALPDPPGAADEPDPIEQTVRQLKGKTIVISSPAALSKAISEILHAPGR